MAHSPKSIVTTVFVALVLDLLAFTIPLPLFPRLIAWYLHSEAHSPSTLLSRLLGLSHSWRSKLLSFSTPALDTTQTGSETRWMWTGGRVGDTSKNWDVVLLGGAMGSLFSLCQCVISPWLGSREWRVLLCTMLGNIASAMIWARSTSFSTFLLSRLVGGLSEGNVQLSTAIISDVTDSSNRSRSLALIGIAFSICFTLGPSLGAYFASRPLPIASSSPTSWNVFALPAAISLVFLIVETLFLAARLPETKSWKKETSANAASESAPIPVEAADQRLKRLNTIGWLHGIFLLFFSGAEFTLTFLTYDLFTATNAQNGRLLSSRHVRPSLARLGEIRMACYGCFTAVFAFICLTLLPACRDSYALSTALLYAAATGLAYTSATVVTSLTAAAASCCDAQGGRAELQRGRALGVVRSKGQLGRAIGPILASSIYWLQGPTICYAVLAVFMAQLSSLMVYLAKQEKERRHRIKSR
ncbi:major facilitator superfamily domain-containing protein [Kockovaella imperatae]|uniref:Major facilitator superfamily domain-containing protein n=1 Tax=Kockovaella imperatae TaxID=4999 RepID=A0A1Y1UEV0_9TREE|nr:major facilitator superfamily domain-containing protein [Kockovaella imperatae]ORX36509.1 major facilitator superfamily domain-containing protein [Kockovaella imperatae]